MTIDNKRTNLRIAHFIDTRTYGGAESLIVDFCRRTLESGDTFIALHFGENKLVDKLAELGVQQLVLPNEKYYKSIKTLPLFSISLRRILRDLNVDILHSHLFGPVCAGALSCWKTNIRHIGTLHDSYTITEKPSRAKLLKLAAKLGTHIVSVSSTIENEFLNVTDIDKNRISVIHNGTKKPAAISNNEKLEMKRILGISANDSVVISIGRLTPIKGYDLLLKVWKNISAKRKAKLLIVGEGPERGKLEKLCEELRITDTVFFTGFREDISNLLYISNIFALSSHSEGLSFSILEAVAHGLPCVVSDVGGNSEIVLDGINGFVVEAGNIEKFTQSIEMILSDSNCAEKLSRNSVKIALDEFNEDKMFMQYWKLYEGN